MQPNAKSIECQVREYAKQFLQIEYGSEIAEKLQAFNIIAVDAYDVGGISEATDKDIKIAIKRDINAGKLTHTTKLIIRHELGHILDKTSTAFPEFQEEMEHERIAWKNAKLKTAAENWYKRVSMQTHKDPLKMQSMGFPRPETKVSRQQLRQGIRTELRRMKEDSPLVDRVLAQRFAMANLIENRYYYYNNHRYF